MKKDKIMRKLKKMNELTDCNLCRYRTNMCDADYDMIFWGEDGHAKPVTDCPGYEADIFVRDLERLWLKKHLSKTLLCEFAGDILTIIIVLPIAYICIKNGWF